MPEKNNLTERTKYRKALKAFRRIYGYKNWWLDRESRTIVKRHLTQLYDQQVTYENEAHLRDARYRWGFRPNRD
jgi:hypothetical protein